MSVVVRRDDCVRQWDRTPVAAALADDLGELLNRDGAVLEFNVHNATLYVGADVSDSWILLETIRD